MQRLADQAAGVEAVDGLGDGAEGAGQAEAPGDGLGDLHRGRRHQPHLLAGVEVGLGQGAGSAPDAAGDVLVVDVVADHPKFLDAVALHDGQGGVAGLLHVGGVLDAGQPEVGLLPGEPQQVAGVEKSPLVEAPAEVEQGRALHDRVVQVEEGRGAGVAEDREPGLLLECEGGLAGDLRRGLAGQDAACRGEALSGEEPSKSGHAVSISTSWDGFGAARLSSCEHRGAGPRARGREGRRRARGPGGVRPGRPAGGTRPRARRCAAGRRSGPPGSVPSRRGGAPRPG